MKYTHEANYISDALLNFHIICESYGSTFMLFIKYKRAICV